MTANQTVSESEFGPPTESTSTIKTAATPPETIDCSASDHDHNDNPHEESEPTSSVPRPGHTFIIRSVPCTRVLTLLNGQITLSKPGTPGASIHWSCIENRGWLGFRNTVSGKFLGHADNSALVCLASVHDGWEKFCVRKRSGRGYVLLMTHRGPPWIMLVNEELWHVGVRIEGEGVERLAKLGVGGEGGIAWEFVEV